MDVHEIIAHQLHAVFRMQSGTANGKVTDFWNSDKKDEIIEYTPSQAVKYDLKKQGYVCNFQTLTVRLIKHTIGDETYVYATTLIDSTRYPADCFPDLYHGRWGIEELYKISKNFIDVENFHAQTERGVKHELYGHLLLINIARLFETDARTMLPSTHKKDDFQRAKGSHVTATPTAAPPFKINFKNCLGVVGRHLENLMFAPKQLISTWLYKAMLNVSKIKQKIRLGRSYPRISLRPRSRWNSFGATSRA